jgi:superfamily I DNA/RNA helicase
MKPVQLLNIRVPGSILLVDESQDMDACQVDWIVRQQVEFGMHVYVVGDPAKAIYGFRGAKPQFLMNLQCNKDCMLTESWHFGPAISRMANLILFAKQNSAQTAFTTEGKPKNWLPYRTRSGVPGKVVRVMLKSLLPDWKTRKVILIARTSATLLREALKAMGFIFSKVVDGGDEDGDEDYKGQNGQASMAAADVHGKKGKQSHLISQEDHTSNKGQNGQVNNAAANVDEKKGNLSHFILQEDHTSYDEFKPATDDGEGPHQRPLEAVPDGFPKIHINERGESSGLRLWKKTLTVKLVAAIYDLSKKEGGVVRLDQNLFPDFSRRLVTWKSFCDEVKHNELSKYSNAINIVKTFGNKTMKAMEMFRVHVMKKHFSAEEADIILSTCHSAKGMEWDNVQVCNDFGNFCKFE